MVATVSQSLRTVHKTRQDETVCVSVIPNQNLWSESVQRGSDPVTHRVMDWSVVRRVVRIAVQTILKIGEIPQAQFLEFLSEDCISPWGNTPHSARVQVVLTFGVVDIEDGVPGREQVECGREDVEDGQKQEREKQEREKRTLKHMTSWMP